MAGIIKRLFRYAVLGIRIVLPTPAEARYARAVRASGLFDRDWYLACNPRLPQICRLLPERHYVLVGEVLGLCPSPQFSPRAYSHLNPEQQASGMPPLAHYITKGRAKGHLVLDRPAGPDAPDLPEILHHTAAQAPHAIVLHLYYRTMWDEIAALIAVQTLAFDLFVTLTEDPDEPDTAIRTRILAAFPHARIWTMPNHGRDILPFLHLAQSGVLRPYLAVCKLHTKKSPHRGDGDAWRRALFAGVLGDPARTAARLAAFRADPVAGLWVADGHHLSGQAWWGPNKVRAAALLAQCGHDPGLEGLSFAAGSIWWISPALLARLADLSLAPADFEPEMGQVDGTTAHILERMFGLVAQRAALHILQASDLDTGG